MRKDFREANFEIILPSLSILAEPPVAVVDSIVDKHGTRKVAKAYLQYLYTPEGQDIAARNFYRPRDSNIGVRPCGWTKSSCRFDRLPSVLILKLGWTEVT